MLFFLKKKPEKAIAKFVTTLPRSQGVGWQEITYRPTPDGGIEKEHQPVARPAEGKPILVIGNTGLSDEEMNFVLEGARKQQEYWSRNAKRKPTKEEQWQMANRMWFEWVEMKKAFLKGVSQFGPSGKTQRMQPPVQNWNGER